jgi:hypothetical protein
LKKLILNQQSLQNGKQSLENSKQSLENSKQSLFLFIKNLISGIKFWWEIKILKKIFKNSGGK